MKRIHGVASVMLYLVALGASAASTIAPHRLLALELVLAPGLSARQVDEAWAKGDELSWAPARLRWLDATRRVRASLDLESPLARMQAGQVRGAGCPTVLVSVDLTAQSGSFSGPLTRAFQACSAQPLAMRCQDEGGASREVRLVESGKSMWQRHRGMNSEEWLQVSSAPGDAGFVTTFERYFIRAGQCQFKRKQAPGMWESDAPFPRRSAFP
jgi:hypothetical protein